MSTLKVDTINTTDGTGNVTISRPIVADIANVTGTLPDGCFPATLPAISGANLTNLPASGGLILLNAQTASTDGTIDFNGFFSSSYDCYMLTVSGAVTSSDGVNLKMRVMIADAIKTDSTGYEWAVNGMDGGSETSSFSTGDSRIQLTTLSGSGTAENQNAVMWIHDPLDTVNYKVIEFTSSEWSATPDFHTYTGGGMYNAAQTALSGVSFHMSTGTIVSGEFRLYGLKNS
jgi:hypothetical protein